MSSMIMRISISSSTTRTLRWDSNLPITRTSRCRYVDRADYAGRPKVEMNTAFQLVGQAPLDHSRPEAVPGRWCDGWAVRLLPAQDKPVALGRPFDRPRNLD